MALEEKPDCTQVKLTPSETESILHSFTGGGTDGCYSYFAGVVLDKVLIEFAAPDFSRGINSDLAVPIWKCADGYTFTGQQTSVFQS